MEKKTYQLHDIPRLLNNPFRLGRIGWMPNHMFIHDHHKLRELFICFILYGNEKSHVLVDGKEFRSKAPYMCVHRPGTLLDTISPACHDEIFLCYEPDVADAWEKFGLKTTFFKLNSRIEALVSGIKGHLEHLYSPGVVDRLEIMAQELVTEAIISGYEMQGKAGHANPKIHELVSYLSRHYTEPLNLEQIWRKYNFSRRTFYREWNKAEPETPIQFILNLRLAHARELLASSTYTIQEIAAVCGFNSPAYMIQRFHAAFGLTPAQYRRSIDDRTEEVHRIFSSQ